MQGYVKQIVKKIINFKERKTDTQNVKKKINAIM